ncbi:MAG TPA: hypothetical protein VJR23_13350 [Candidatus Acidoferrales bacterium]|nr:hypothetical protein [Candidatus Acidoferrales bacterium]
MAPIPVFLLLLGIAFPEVAVTTMSLSLPSHVVPILVVIPVMVIAVVGVVNAIFGVGRTA